jgi:hypothetical protein
MELNYKKLKGQCSPEYEWESKEIVTKADVMGQIFRANLKLANASAPFL